MNKKTRPNYMLPIRDIHFNFKDIHSLKVKRWKKTFYANGKEKKAGAVRKDEKVYYIMTDQSIQEEDTTFVKIYVPNMLLLLSHFSRVQLCVTP